MNAITNSDIQAIAVRCVSDYFNAGTPLSEGLAKEAQALDLNSDQLKRAVEATNTLTQLKSVQVNKDRTGEFTVANYDDIVKLAALEEPVKGLPSGGGEFPVEGDLTKSAAVSTETYDLPVSGKLELLRKCASQNRKQIDCLSDDLVVVTSELTKLAYELSTLPEQDLSLGLSSNLDESGFSKVASFLGHTGQFKDYAKDLGLNSNANDLVVSLLELTKQASDIKAELAKRDLSELAAIEVEDSLLKQAGLVGNITAAARKAAQKIVSPVLSKGAPSLKKAPLPERISKGLTQAATRLVTAPVRGVASSVAGSMKSSLKAVGNFAESKVTNVATGTSLGKKVGIKPVGITKETTDTLAKTKKRLIATGVVGAGALDAMAYDPAPSGNVWDKLQG